MNLTAYDLASRYVGIKEIAGNKDHPLVQWWLSLCGFSLETHDEVAWCSAFVNGIAWELRLPRSKSAAARSNLLVGTPILLADAKPGFDVVVFKRGDGDQPGPEVTAAPGHVGFFAGVETDGRIIVLGGNQSNGVCLAHEAASSLLGIRRLA